MPSENFHSCDIDTSLKVLDRRSGRIMERAIPFVSGENRDGQRGHQNVAIFIIRKCGLNLKPEHTVKTTADGLSLLQARGTDVLWQNDKFTEKGE